MSAIIEALYVYDEQNNCILEHVYRSRPPSAKSLLSQFKSHPAPRPALLYLSELSPPTAVASVHHSNTLFLCPSSTDQNALALLEFIHRVIDIFEDFLGPPLLAHKIDSNYDIVGQLLNEVCDGGAVSNTEPNALRENVEVAGLIGRLFTHVGLPSSSPALGPSNSIAAGLKGGYNVNSGPAIPWRRPNVRHTSNELYVDILENISVILAPSGRPISAISSGSIAFTAKLSGIPDLLLTLSAPGGTSSSKRSTIARVMRSPVFHPCVRLARWRERPGELSFVPPDGRFVLAGYEVDLLPSYVDVDVPPSRGEKLFLPATVDLRTGLGEKGSDFEVLLTLKNEFPGSQTWSKSGTNHGSPSLEAVVVTVPLPVTVRSVTDLRASRGEALFQQFEHNIEWKVPTKDGGPANGTAVLTGSLLGPISAEGLEEDRDESEGNDGTAAGQLLGYYEEGSTNVRDTPQALALSRRKGVTLAQSQSSAHTPPRRLQANKGLMPRSVSVSFTVRGWLPSGIKVDSLTLDTKKSKDIFSKVTPFKGVKYVAMSRRGVERRS